MDLDDFRLILRSSGVDVWTFIDTAISVASLDYRDELKSRRDGITERLFASTVPHCRNCDLEKLPEKKMEEEAEAEEPEEEEEDEREEERQVIGRRRKAPSPTTPPTSSGVNSDEDRGYDPHSVDSEQERLLVIKEQLEDPDQGEDSLVELLDSLNDMDITFKALKETDLGRQISALRKHPSGEVGRLAKQLVRKWKDLVDEWVKSNTPDEVGGSSIVGYDSPLQQTPPRSSLSHKPTIKNGGSQVSDMRHSRNPIHGSERSNVGESGSSKGKKRTLPPTRETPAKEIPPTSSSSTFPKKDGSIDLEKLASARKRLHENYQEAQNARKQRTIQVMDLHDIPKPKNAFFSRNKGSSQAKHW